MATADINLPDGTKIRIEGSPEEIAKVIALYVSSGMEHAKPVTNDGRRRIGVSAPLTGDIRRKSTARVSGGVMQYIRELIGEGYFAERRSISDVQTKLEELGRIYPQTHLSTPLRRLVRNRELRRLKEGSSWIYAQL